MERFQGGARSLMRRSADLTRPPPRAAATRHCGSRSPFPAAPSAWLTVDVWDHFGSFILRAAVDGRSESHIMPISR